PTMVFSRPARSYVAALELSPRPPFVQIATSFQITGPRATPTTALGGSMVGAFPPAPFHAFKKSAWKTQTGRQGAMFTGDSGYPAADREVLRGRQRVRGYDGVRDLGGTAHLEHGDRRVWRRGGLRAALRDGVAADWPRLCLLAHRHAREGSAVGGLSDDDD